MRYEWLAAGALAIGLTSAGAQPPAETPAKPETPPAAKGNPSAAPTTAGETPAGKSTAPMAASELYPLKVGTKWTYQIGQTTIVVRVASTDEDGAKLETVVGDRVLATEVIKVGPDAITRTKINNSKIDQPVIVLKLQNGKAVKGDTWEVNSKVQDSEIVGKFEIKGDAEDVKVPLGDFKAVLVEGPEFKVAGTTTAVKYWFAPGKGIVKLFYSLQGNESVLELKEFTEGK